jgi:hypothetical protein
VLAENVHPFDISRDGGLRISLFRSIGMKAGCNNHWMGEPNRLAEQAFQGSWQLEAAPSTGEGTRG